MIYYFILINILTFILYGIDKKKAIKGKYRISEYHLLLCSFIGGFIGSFFGMKLFHHKTKKILFWFFNIFCTIMWIIIYLEIHSNILHK